MSARSPLAPVTRRVLIWAKTYPELSGQYKETVCTAGCFEDGSPVRLYPIPLRYLDAASRYQLYDWVEVPLVRHTPDSRPESFRLGRPEIHRVGHLDTDRDRSWASRRDVISRDTTWHYDCLDGLKAAQAERKASLGLVRVGRISKIRVVRRPEVERREHDEKLRRLRSQTSLFDTTIVKHLAFQTFRIHVWWECAGSYEGRTCPGHSAGVLDWGLGELGRKKGPDAAAQRMTEIADLSRRDLHFFVGNFKAHPKNFGIIGLWYPPKRPPPPPTLFDP